jgi:hypothetical protein
MVWLDTRKASALLAIALSAGCSEASVPPAPPERSPSPATTVDAASQAQHDAGSVEGGMAPTAGLTPSVTAVPSVVCPGECSELRATLPAGRPPFTWRWDQGLPAHPGPHQVCPTQTTRYRVEVEDTASTDLEFPLPRAQGAATVTLTVRSDCRDGGVDDAAGIDAGADAAEPLTPAESCSIRIPLDPPMGDGPGMVGSASSDAAGSLYLAAMMTGGAQLGPALKLVTQPHGMRVFLAKYDARCQLAWAHWLGEPHQTARLGSIEVSASGRVAVTRTYFVEPAHEADYRSELSIFTPEGELSLTVPSAGGDLTPEAQMHGLAWSHDGSLAVAGLPDLCPTRKGSGVCVAKLAADGKLLFGRLIGGAFGAGVALDTEGNLIAAGLSGNDGVVVDGLTFDAARPPYAYVTKLDPKGTPLWLATTSNGDDSPTHATQGFVSAAADGSLLAVWNAGVILPPGNVVQVATMAWRLTAAGAQSALHTLQTVGSHGRSEPVHTVGRGAELLSAEYLLRDLTSGVGPVPGTTRLMWHDADGTLLRGQDLEERAFMYTSSVRLSASDAPILVLREHGASPVSGTQTALLLRRLAP